jgi:alpha-tubulin suppressor-like RCC1 family protein
MSWGQNRFAQLGYVIEPPEEKAALKAFAASAITGEDTIQNTPKRIVGPLKKEHVIGVAASRMCSACWTWDTVWTWGTNSGQLGERRFNSMPVPATSDRQALRFNRL